MKKWLRLKDDTDNSSSMFRTEDIETINYRPSGNGNQGKLICKLQSGEIVVGDVQGYDNLTLDALGSEVFGD